MFSKKELLNFLTGWLVIAGILAAFTGCDTLAPDSINDQSHIAIKNQPIVITPKSSGIIDLNSLITSTSGTHTFVISSEPRLGKLESLGNDLLQYTPNQGVSEGHDGFKLSIFGKDNVVVDEDTINIIITRDSTAYACGVWAFQDYIYDVDGPVTIDVLANDTACNVDLSQLVLSLPEIMIAGNQITAEFGTVQIAGNKIVYTPGPDYNGSDAFYYQITKPKDIPYAGDAEQTCISMVFIIGKQACIDGFEVGDDSFHFPLDSAASDSLTVSDVYLDVMGNDSWCPNETPVIDIVEQPAGQLVYNPDTGFVYTPPQQLPAGNVDKFRYRVCLSAVGCKEANVTIRFE
jgi:hypothetical protein